MILILFKKVAFNTVLLSLGNNDICFLGTLKQKASLFTLELAHYMKQYQYVDPRGDLFIFPAEIKKAMTPPLLV